jgi:hypothetical protein
MHVGPRVPTRGRGGGRELGAVAVVAAMTLLDQASRSVDQAADALLPAAVHAVPTGRHVGLLISQQAIVRIVDALPIHEGAAA